MNYFEFFDLPLSPSVDQAALKRRFLANSRAFHPDFHTLASGAEQDAALEKSTHNNRGYKILADDHERLRHFLELKELLGAEGENKVPQEFLARIMDLNEALMELEFNPTPATKEAAQKRIADLENQLTASVGPVLDDYDDATATESELAALRDYYLKKRYLLRLRGKI